MKKITLITISLIVAVTGNSISQNLPDVQVGVHHDSDIEFTVTNFGILGSEGGNYIDPETGFPAPGVEFPLGSDIEYLFLGALWIGAVVDTVDENGNPVLDTLVSVGNDGWWSTICELWPPPVGEDSFWEDQVIGDEEFFAIYSDTSTDSRYIPNDPTDNRPHIPLGLKITQNSIGWSSDGMDQLFIINYVLENIGGRSLHDAWIAIYYDGDVFHLSENPNQGAQDDLCGFIQHGNYGIGWIIDNDGQPESGDFTSISPRGATGIIPLGASQPGLQTNFNWWISNVNTEYDWGPQLQSNFDIWESFPCGGIGTPCGDKAKYQIMSNSEHDYGQIWSALDHTEDGWIPGVSNAENIADGFDARFLISFGSLEIAPGAVETVTVAMIAGDNIHVDPENFSQRLENHTDDSLSIAEYYDNLDFSEFLEVAGAAIDFYESQTSVDDNNIALPAKTTLMQNYPNPFNAQTTIRFRLAEPGNTRIVVYNIVGQQVALLHDGIKQAGEHSFRWNADELPSGIYFARLIAGDVHRSVKLILLK
ncbi:MAG: T9SS type A sorting domain-containing protein [candidate division Zixibacteria bacterium]